MSQYRQQRTIARPARISGRGYWSGREVEVAFCPAAPGSGIHFRRTDMPGSPPIPATVRHRVEVPLRTNLAVSGAAVEMVEHLLAALAGLGIDNCEICVNAAEMPGNDGSCQLAVEALVGAGVVEQGTVRQQICVGQTIRVADGEQWIEIGPSPEPGLTVAYTLDFGCQTAVGRQHLELSVAPEAFRAEIAPARTFILEADAARLREAGLGIQATYQDLLVFGPDGPIDNVLRFPDECVRHKILDVIGDLSLAGCDLHGRVVAYRSGHRLNAQLVSAVLETYELDYLPRKTA